MPLADQPLLTLLGRRGRGAVAEALLEQPDRDWSVRALARAAKVTATTASRAIRELENLGAVSMLRPGRDAIVRFHPETATGRDLMGLRLLDLRRTTAQRFAAVVERPPTVRAIHWWSDIPDHPALPEIPTRIALLCSRATDRALEAVGPALDVLRHEGLPQPDVTVWRLDELGADDPVAKAILDGTPL